MNEKDLNIEYICEKTLLAKDDELVPIILDLIKDSYKSGLCQAEFDNTMNLIEENQELKKHLEVPETCNLKTLEDYKSYYEDTTREQILEDTYIEYCGYVNLAHRYSELKKQLEEWENHLKCSKEMLDIQGKKGNYDYDEYMLGLYNGMEYIIALFETREPNYISGKDVKFTNNKTQQKEFIKYLEDEKDRLARKCSNIYEDGLGKTRLVNEDIFNEVNKNLQKYKEIIGDDK